MTAVSRTHLRKLTRLSPREWADLLEAQLSLLVAQFQVWTRPTGRLVSHLPDSSTTAPAATSAAGVGENGPSPTSETALPGDAAVTAAGVGAAIPAPADAAKEVGVEEATLSRAEALALAVGRAAEFGVFRPLCLVRAVALNRVLERHGIKGSRVRVGVRMRNGRFAAHAWVEYGDRVLGDNEAHVGSFVELSEVRLVDAR